MNDFFGERFEHLPIVASRLIKDEAEKLKESDNSPTSVSEDAPTSNPEDRIKTGKTDEEPDS